MKKSFVILLVVLSIAACGKSNPTPSPVLNPSGGKFKTIDVFGIQVLATQKVPDNKVLHAANVMAEYLDNNEDGVADNPAIIKALVDRKAFLIMSRDESDERSINFNDLPSSVSQDAGQNLYAHETYPEGSSTNGFDATLEEVLHLITHVGYANAYPDVWGEKTGTSVAKTMDKARGRHFNTVPAQYPTGAWYTYDDQTCDYSCMITEYTYWALTSILGAQDYAGRLNEIGNEWKLNTQKKVQQQDPDVYALLTNPVYKFARVLPDGDYKGKTLTLK